MADGYMGTSIWTYPMGTRPLEAPLIEHTFVAFSISGVLSRDSMGTSKSMYPCTHFDIAIGQRAFTAMYP